MCVLSLDLCFASIRLQSFMLGLDFGNVVLKLIEWLHVHVVLLACTWALPNFATSTQFLHKRKFSTPKAYH